MRIHHKRKPSGVKENIPPEFLQRRRKQIRKDLLKRDGGKCFYCDHPFTDEFPPTIEHLLPISCGGLNNVANMVLACAPCNQKVGNWPLIRKIKYREFRLITKM